VEGFFGPSGRLPGMREDDAHVRAYSMKRPLLLCCGALALVASSPSRAPRRAQWRVIWSPVHPAQGSLVSLSVYPDSSAGAGSEAVTFTAGAAGEPLHFDAITGEGRYWALAAVPLDAPDSMMVRLTVEHDGGATDTLAFQVPIASRAAGTDSLHRSTAMSHMGESSVVARGMREADEMRAARLRSHDVPRLWREPFVRPVPGRVTSGFGTWRAWDGVLKGRHDGVDLAGAAGTPVRAANRGGVALVAAQYYGGLTILIDHGAGLVTSYQHLSHAGVAVGDTVVRGAVIGRVGATGNVTGPHLHWGASYGGIQVDALTLLAVEPP
jgi:murein DD-endopeptidase MepM/ murein hydrolase activator NlpD